MAVNDIDTLREQPPDLFDDRQLPPGWEEDWLVIPIDDPEVGSAAAINAPDYEDRSSLVASGVSQARNRIDFTPESEMPSFDQYAPFPGSPHSRVEGTVSPPDALAFYLPFHYFHPTWWGIYLVLERVHWLAHWLDVLSDGAVAGLDAVCVARLFLYGHEAFHHSVEAFATRLEITHRTPLYREAFERYFRKSFGTDDSMEEALATAYGYRKVKERAFKRPNDPPKRDAALKALQEYIKACPPGYNQALRFVKEGPFAYHRALFAEENHHFALPGIRECQPTIWKSSPQAFTGISRITSRVNYLVRRGSPLAERYRLGLRYRDLSGRLQETGCRFLRPGKGSHEIWQSREGQRFSVPRHPGDLRKGTLAKIIKQAGFNMSVAVPSLNPLAQHSPPKVASPARVQTTEATRWLMEMLR